MNTTMQKLELNEMSRIEGGIDCSIEAQRKYAVIALTAGILSFIPVIGGLTFGPTAVGAGAAGTYCVFQEVE